MQLFSEFETLGSEGWQDPESSLVLKNTELRIGPTSKVSYHRTAYREKPDYKGEENTMKNVAKMHVGVDVSKTHLDVCVHSTGKKARLANNIEGIKKLQEMFPKESVEQIVCEASGGYENTFVNQCASDGYSVWIVEPRRIKGFAKAMGIKAKNDQIDAKIIALFSASIKRNYEQTPITPEQLHLKEIVKRKGDLVKILTMEKARLKNPRYVKTRKSILRHIAFLEEQVEELRQEALKIVKSSNRWKEVKTKMETIPGVGSETATALIADMPELGTITGKQAASLIGVAPFTRQSGSYVGHAKIRDGRFAPRRALYMAALTAAHYNTVLKAFYQRLKKKGKAAKVCIVAVMRKLIVIINAMIRDNTKWNEEILLKNVDFKHSL